jgi:hypothetical protein
MKRIVSYAFAFTLLFLAGTAFSQGYTFRVLANKGTNKVKKSSGQEISLKTGATLDAGDKLIAGADAYIGLMHKSGKTIEVRKSGTMDVAELEKQVTTGATSVASRYAKFVNEKMNEEGTGGYRSRMNATGAVSRAVADGSLKAMLSASDGTVKVIGDNAIIRWNTDKTGATYIVSVKNIEATTIFETETDKTFIELDFTSDDLSNDLGVGLYILTVTDKGDESLTTGDIGIKRSMDDDALNEELEGLRSEVPEDSPLSKLIYASFFEEKGLLLDALTKYEEAIKMAPEVQDFQELYKNFLITNGLSEE